MKVTAARPPLTTHLGYYEVARKLIERPPGAGAWLVQFLDADGLVERAIIAASKPTITRRGFTAALYTGTL